MKNLEKINTINTVACFLALGASAVLQVWPLGILALPILGGEIITRYRISKNKSPLSLLPTIYKKVYTRELENYLRQSESLLEKRLKLTMVSYALYKQNLEANDYIYDLHNKNYQWSEDLEITSISGDKMLPFRNSKLWAMNYWGMLKKDLPINKVVLNKLYGGFSHLGLLGEQVVRLFGQNTDSLFIGEMSEYKLQDSDIEKIKLHMGLLQSLPPEQQRINTPPVKIEKEFLWKIIEANADKAELLRDYYYCIFYKNTPTPLNNYPELLNHLDSLANSYKVKNSLENTLQDNVKLIKRSKI